MRNSYFSGLLFCYPVAQQPPSYFLDVIIELKMAEFHSSKFRGGRKDIRENIKALVVVVVVFDGY